MSKPNCRMTCLAIGGAIAASLLNAAAAELVRATDDWVTLRPPAGGFHVRIPPDWVEDGDQNLDNGLSFRPTKENTAAVEFVNCKAQAGFDPLIASSTQELLDAAVSAGPAPAGVTDELLFTLGKDAVLRENILVQVSNHPAYYIVVAGSHETIQSAGG